MYARPPGGGGDDGGGGRAVAYERAAGRLAWPGGGIEQMNIGGRGSRDPLDPHDDDHQRQRLERERGRLVPAAPDREDWEGRYRGGEALPPPQSPPRERAEAGGRSDAGRDVAASRRWESERPEAAREETQWRGGGGSGEGGGSGFLSSSPSASRAGRPSQQQQEREPEGEEEREQDRGLNPPASARPSTRETDGPSDRPDAEEKEAEEEEKMEHPEAGSRQRHPEQGGSPGSPRDSVRGEGPVPKNGGTDA